MKNIKKSNITEIKNRYGYSIDGYMGGSLPLSMTIHSTDGIYYVYLEDEFRIDGVLYITKEFPITGTRENLHCIMEISDHLKCKMFTFNEFVDHIMNKRR